MAKTYPKLSVKVIIPSDPVLGFLEDTMLETGSSTFNAGSPLVLTSGLTAEAASPLNPSGSGLVVGWALTAGNNVAAGATNVTSVCRHVPGLRIEANLLTTAAADYVLLATDKGVAYDFAKSTTLLPSSYANRNGWYILNSTSQAIMRVIGFKTSYSFPNSVDGDYALAGDTNARVTACLVPGKSYEI